MDRETSSPREPAHPLAKAVSAMPGRSSSGKSLLADGCYLVYYGLVGIEGAAFEGTLRVETTSGQLVASGDLYLREADPYRLTRPIGQMPPPDAVAGIPIFPIKAYRYYLRVMQIEPTEAGFSFVFEAHRFSPQPALTLEGNETNWVLEATYTAQIAPAAAPAGFPRPELFFVGEVSNEIHSFGEMQIGWVAPLLRKATIEIDRVPESELPLNNGVGACWRSVFETVGWDVTAAASNSDVTKPDGPVWTATDAHRALLARRDPCDLDAEWRYHVLAVQLINHPDGERGVMYDKGNDDINTVPREDLLVSSHYVFPANEARWGDLRGKRTATTVAYFRTAVHEMGHAMGLDHDIHGTGFMRPTVEIADDGGTSFPSNITWSFSPETERQLRHWPDIVVRPGGLFWGAGPGAPLGGI